MLRLLFFIIVLIASPLSAQQLDVEAGLWFSGPIVSEVTHRVRLGNMGQDMYGSLSVSDNISENWRVGGDFMAVPTHLYVYPATKQNKGWLSRPEGATRREPLLWSCTTLGTWYDRNWFSVGTGLGMCHISGADYGYFGAAPMHHIASRIDLSVNKAITDGMDFSLKCRAHPGPVRGEDYTVLQIASGRLEPINSGSSHEWHWMINGGCGLSLNMHVGN